MKKNMKEGKVPKFQNTGGRVDLPVRKSLGSTEKKTLHSAPPVLSQIPCVSVSPDYCAQLGQSCLWTLRVPGTSASAKQGGKGWDVIL